MKVRFPSASLLLTVVLVGVVVSCSQAKETEPDFADPGLPGRDANPEGVPYPTDHIGGAPRTRTRRGDRVPNLTFQAYVDGDRASGLKTISLADYYDPTRLRHRILHLQVAAVWCTICAGYIEATVAAKESLGKEGVVFLEVLAGGQSSSGGGPSLREVGDWVERHRSTITTAIDARGVKLASAGVPSQVMPWDIMLDTRTMEILDSAGGAPIDLIAYDRSFLKVVATRPAAY